MKIQILSVMIAALAGNAMAAVFDMGSFKDTEFKLFYGKDADCEKDARAVCRRDGGELADVTSHNFSYLVKQLKKVPKVSRAYVDSWNGDDYGNTCIALYQGGSIVVPPEGCKGPTAFICQYECENSRSRRH